MAGMNEREVSGELLFHVIRYSKITHGKYGYISLIREHIRRREVISTVSSPLF